MTENSSRSSASNDDFFFGCLFLPWLLCWGVVLVENVADAVIPLPGGTTRFAAIWVLFWAPDAAFGGGESRSGVVSFLAGSSSGRDWRRTLFSLVFMGKLESIVDSSSPLSWPSCPASDNFAVA